MTACTSCPAWTATRQRPPLTRPRIDALRALVGLAEEYESAIEGALAIWRGMADPARAAALAEPMRETLDVLDDLHREFSTTLLRALAAHSAPETDA